MIQTLIGETGHLNRMLSCTVYRKPMQLTTEKGKMLACSLSCKPENLGRAADFKI